MEDKLAGPTDRSWSLSVSLRMQAVDRLVPIRQGGVRKRGDPTWNKENCGKTVTNRNSDGTNLSQSYVRHSESETDLQCNVLV